MLFKVAAYSAQPVPRVSRIRDRAFAKASKEREYCPVSRYMAPSSLQAAIICRGSAAISGPAPGVAFSAGRSVWFVTSMFRLLPSLPYLFLRSWNTRFYYRGQEEVCFTSCSYDFCMEAVCAFPGNFRPAAEMSFRQRRDDFGQISAAVLDLL